MVAAQHIRVACDPQGSALSRGPGRVRVIGPSEGRSALPGSCGGAYGDGVVREPTSWDRRPVHMPSVRLGQTLGYPTS